MSMYCRQLLVERGPNLFGWLLEVKRNTFVDFR